MMLSCQSTKLASFHREAKAWHCMHFVLQQGRCGSMMCTLVILFLRCKKKYIYISVGNPNFNACDCFMKKTVSSVVCNGYLILMSLI